MTRLKYVGMSWQRSLLFPRSVACTEQVDETSKSHADNKKLNGNYKADHV